MLTQAFYTGLSGLKNSGTAIDAISDNIANVNTVGYRGYDVEFSSMFEEVLATSGNIDSTQNSVGMGSQVQVTSMIAGNGSLTLTDRSTDLAINGDGWFGIQGNSNTLYTRAGNFTFDVNSDLVTTDGYHVMGTLAGNIEGELLTKKVDTIALSDVSQQKPLNFPKVLTYPAEPTANVEFLGNIGFGEQDIVMSSSVIDSQNNRNKLELRFSIAETQVPPGTQWNVSATTQSLDGSVNYDTQSGTISFDEKGALVSNSLTTIDNNGSMVNINLGEGFTGIVSIDSTNLTSSSVADGNIGGDLIGYEVNKNAEVIATFTNGMQSSVGKVAVFHFQNNQGLERIDSSKFSISSNSGDAIFYQDSEGNNILGTDIQNFQLENSNIKMEVSLTELIVHQRSYDANSKSLTTADEMMQKALSMDA
ncbi:MAG: flagellar hook-basal body complex protein [Campylobacterota bacterium]|nr:flagellar hook-basal body complex protein [Campylobacterota bacterium]